MPRPLYIICSESGAQDARTGLFSIFNVIERLEVQTMRIPLPEDAERPSMPHFADFINLRAVSVWMKLPDDDPALEYEHEFVLHFPDGQERVPMRSVGRPFPDDDRPLSRYVLDVKMNALDHAGTLTVESRLRLTGTQEWQHRQDYPMLVVVVPPENISADDRHVEIIPKPQ